MNERLKNLSQTTKIMQKSRTSVLSMMQKRVNLINFVLYSIFFFIEDSLYEENETEIEKEELYDMAVKNNELENEIKNIVDQMNILIIRETDRVFGIFSHIVLDEKNLIKFKNILKCLFGLKETEKKLEFFFKFVNENKVNSKRKS